MSDELPVISEEPEPERKNLVFRVIVFLLVIAITAVIIAFQGYIQDFIDTIPGMGVFAYPAIFLASIVANATVIIPVPGVALTALMGAFFNPLLVAVFAGAGASIGELSGYFAGFSGQIMVDQTRWYGRLEKWMRQYGDITILVLAFIPNPLFDMAGMIAGMLRLPLYRFIFWCAIGKILKMIMFAYLGDYFIGLF